MRVDHKYILEMIEPSSHVLDLGCGDGELLSLLMKEKNCRAAGIESMRRKSMHALSGG